MDGQQMYNSESKPAYRDIEQLVKHGSKLHDQALYEALAGVINRLKSVLTKRADWSFGAKRLKQN